MDAFFTFIIPPLIVVLLAFGALLLCTEDETKMDRHETKTTVMLAYFAALFFIVVTSQVSMRRELNAQSLTYLDYYYLGSYLMLFLSSLNVMVLNSDAIVPPIQWKESLMPKLLFFPILMTFLVTMTVLTYY